MLNEKILADAEAKYLEYLPLHFRNEDFKWKAIRHFQNNWDIEAPDFAAMLDRALAKTDRLLTSSHYLPRTMLVTLAKEDPEAVRAQLRMLYDESGDLCSRIDNFSAYADDCTRRHSDAAWEKKGYTQSPMSISVLLWLRYPDKYYIYKYKEVRPAAEIIGSEFLPQRVSSASNMVATFRLCDKIRDHLIQNEALVEKFRSLLTADCYPDPQCRTLTFDFVFYINRYYKDDIWFTENYNPGLSVEKWKELLANRGIFTETSLEIMKRMLDIGGQASCAQLAERYGEDPGFYNMGSTQLAMRIIKAKICPEPPDYDAAKYWPVIYFGKPADNGKGVYVWRLRDELKQALEQTDLSDVDLYAAGKEPEIDDPGNGDDHTTTDPVPEDEPELPEEPEPYTRADFLSEVFMPEEKLEQLMGLVRRKKNVILQGAPGVGKTFTAKRLAWLMLGRKDEQRIASVQFHQSYSYEDFIMGYKPDGEAFALQTGIFYDFCKKAGDDPEHDYFFIIDEINRGNLSKIFGELLQLIEADNRGSRVLLAYDHDEPFSVPGNLFLIGMMNTADRSLALIDYALRRRFSFFEMNPGFDTEGFRKYAATIHDENFGPLVEKLIALNRDIEDDPTLGRGFRIGHSYLCLAGEEEYSEDWLQSVVEYDIIPTLQEYWFDNSEKLKKWEDELRGVFNG